MKRRRLIAGVRFPREFLIFGHVNLSRVDDMGRLNAQLLQRQAQNVLFIGISVNPILTTFPNRAKSTSMKLQAYLDLNGVSYAIFAKTTKIASASGVRKWALGERMPRPAALLAIWNATKGQVTAADFLRDRK
jgi:hypothetical protein